MVLTPFLFYLQLIFGGAGVVLGRFLAVKGRFLKKSLFSDWLAMRGFRGFLATFFAQARKKLFLHMRISAKKIAKMRFCGFLRNFFGAKKGLFPVCRLKMRFCVFWGWGTFLHRRGTRGLRAFSDFTPPLQPLVAAAWRLEVVAPRVNAEKVFYLG